MNMLPRLEAREGEEVAKLKEDILQLRAENDRLG